jgi:hypothetical protein
VGGGASSCGFGLAVRAECDVLKAVLGSNRNDHKLFEAKLLQGLCLLKGCGIPPD